MTYTCTKVQCTKACPLIQKLEDGKADKGNTYLVDECENQGKKLLNRYKEQLNGDNGLIIRDSDLFNRENKYFNRDNE